MKNRLQPIVDHLLNEGDIQFIGDILYVKNYNYIFSQDGINYQSLIEGNFDGSVELIKSIENSKSRDASERFLFINVIGSATKEHLRSKLNNIQGYKNVVVNLDVNEIKHVDSIIDHAIEHGINILLSEKLPLTTIAQHQEKILKHRLNVIANDTFKNIVGFLNSNPNAHIKHSHIHLAYDDIEEFENFIFSGKIQRNFRTFWIQLNASDKQLLSFIHKFINFLISTNEYNFLENIRVIADYVCQPTYSHQVDIHYQTEQMNWQMEEGSICKKCWAQSICWSTSSYRFFGAYPSYFNKDQEACDFIRDIISSCIKGIYKLKKNYYNEIFQEKEYEFEQFVLKKIN